MKSRQNSERTTSHQTYGSDCADPADRAKVLPEHHLIAPAPLDIKNHLHALLRSFHRHLPFVRCDAVDINAGHHVQFRQRLSAGLPERRSCSGFLVVIVERTIDSEV